MKSHTTSSETSDKGIFLKHSATPNLKCIVFALLIVLLYVASVKQREINWMLTPILFIVAYIGMAWYDETYNCGDKLYSGTSSPGSIVDSIFKPQRREGEYVEDQEAMYLRNVYIFHLAIVAPFLIYISTIKDTRDIRILALVLAVAVIAYHGFRLYSPRRNTQKFR